MARETSGFDGWLRTVEFVTREVPLVSALYAVSRLAREAFGAHLWFVEILGRRWSHIAGEGGAEPGDAPVARILLDGRFSLVSDTWGTASDEDRARLVAFLRNLVRARELS
jgi:hypothetical protein